MHQVRAVGSWDLGMVNLKQWGRENLVSNNWQIDIFHAMKRVDKKEIHLDCGLNHCRSNTVHPQYIQKKH